MVKLHRDSPLQPHAPVKGQLMYLNFTFKFKFKDLNINVLCYYKNLTRKKKFYFSFTKIKIMSTQTPTFLNLKSQEEAAEEISQDALVNGIDKTGKVTVECALQKGSIGFVKSKLHTPFVQTRVWIRVPDNDGQPTMEFKITARAEEFKDLDNLKEPKTIGSASFISDVFQYFGPKGKVNEKLAEELPAIVKEVSSKKANLGQLKKISSMNKAQRIEAVAKDARAGYFSGSGDGPRFMPKQSVKTWQKVIKTEDGEKTETFVQFTYENKKLFMPATKTESEQAKDIALFREGSALRSYQEAHPEMKPNYDAFRVVSEIPQPDKKESWIDIARTISDETRGGMLWASAEIAPWKVWLMTERGRIIYTYFLNTLNVYSVVNMDGEKKGPILNDGQKARAKRRAELQMQRNSKYQKHSDDDEDDEEEEDDE